MVSVKTIEAKNQPKITQEKTYRQWTEEQKQVIRNYFGSYVEIQRLVEKRIYCTKLYNKQIYSRNFLI